MSVFVAHKGIIYTSIKQIQYRTPRESQFFFLFIHICATQQLGRDVTQGLPLREKPIWMNYTIFSTMSPLTHIGGKEKKTNQRQ